jgi:hypothetical protein
MPRGGATDRAQDLAKDSMLSKYKSVVNDDGSDINGRLETPLILKSHKATKESDDDPKMLKK